MMRILLLILWLGSICGYAQIKSFSVYLGSNYSLTKDVVEESILTSVPASSGYWAMYTNAGTIRESFTGQPGIEVSGKFSYGISSRFFLSSGISFNYIRFKRSNDIETRPDSYTYVNLQNPINPGTYQGTVYGSLYSRSVDENGNILYTTDNGFYKSPDIGKTSALYVQIPMLAGCSFFNNRLSVQSGITTSFIVAASQYKQQYSLYGGISTVKDRNTGDFKRVLVGATLQTTYLITRSLGFDISLQNSFTPIYDDGARYAGKARYRIISAGLSYTFLK